MRAPYHTLQSTPAAAGREPGSVTPVISVLIPAHNEENFIGRCIASVIATGWPADRLEIVVIDHQSTDATATVARASGARILSADRGITIGAVRNVGLAAAREEFAEFVDAICVVTRRADVHRRFAAEPS